jgi:beta-carotene 3-hydroxylase
VPKRGYFKRLLQAHRLHHAVEGKDGTVSHGFLFARSPAALKAQLRGRAAPRRAEPAQPPLLPVADR